MALQARIEAAITASTGARAGVLSSTKTQGGCINDSRVVTLDDGRRYFVKTNARAEYLPGLFETEYLALQRLAEPGIIHVPKPLAYETDFIVLEVFEQGLPALDWQEQMGRQLAGLHTSTSQKCFGFDKRNYLGTSEQPNDWQDSWLTFYREQRLGWQLKLFSNKAAKDDPLLSLGYRLMEQLDTIIGQINEPAVLLHGDLWSGNAAADQDGAPVIFDPASYYGHREAELGMMRLFGGFNADCEAAYNEIWPLQPEAERRIALYRLYHELNHLNLFGSSYYPACLSTIKSLL